MTISRKGRCQCGEVRYEIHGEIVSFICHCESCRKSASAPFVAWSKVSRNDLKLTQGRLKNYKSSSKVTRTFCDKCGAGIGYSHEDDALYLDVLTVTLEDFESIKPTYHLMLKEKITWINIDDGLQQYQEWKDS